MLDRWRWRHLSNVKYEMSTGHMPKPLGQTWATCCSSGGVPLGWSTFPACNKRQRVHHRFGITIAFIVVSIFSITRSAIYYIYAKTSLKLFIGHSSGWMRTTNTIKEVVLGMERIWAKDLIGHIHPSIW